MEQIFHRVQILRQLKALRAYFTDRNSVSMKTLEDETAFVDAKKDFDKAMLLFKSFAKDYKSLLRIRAKHEIEISQKNAAFTILANRTKEKWQMMVDWEKSIREHELSLGEAAHLLSLALLIISSEELIVEMEPASKPYEMKNAVLRMGEEFVAGSSLPRVTLERVIEGNEEAGDQETQKSEEEIGEGEQEANPL